jgi:bacterioferritin-associated ferredoxin
LTTILVSGEIGVVLNKLASPTMYVCVCHGVTDSQIRRAAEEGVREVHELTMRTGAGASCGSCLGLAAQLLDEHHATRALPLPVLRAA